MSTPDGAADRTDRGAALMLALAVLIIGGLVTSALAGYAMTSLRVGAVAETRAERALAAEMAVRVGIAKQRELGASRCLTDQVGRISSNGVVADLRCETLDVVLSSRDPVTGRDRMGVTITNLDPVTQVLSGGSFGGTAFDGIVYVAGGDLGDPPTNLRAPDGLRLSQAPYPNADPLNLVDPRSTGVRYLSPSNQPPVTCAAGFAGTALNAAPACEPTGTWWEASGQPVLPVRIPRVEDNRQRTPRATIGSCRVFYPGTYPSGLEVAGDDPVYFASGVYYFEAPVTLGGGAEIVGGAGAFTPCTTDAEAAFDENAPADPLINGRGVTFVFGAAGRLSVRDNGTRVLLNRRVGGPTTRTTSGWSIVGVHPLVSGPALEAPALLAANADGTLVDAAGPGGYSAVTATAPLLSVDLRNDARLTVRSGIYAATSSIDVAVTTSAELLDVTGGVTARQIAMPQGPLPPGSVFGLASEPVQRTVRLTATVAGASGPTLASVAVLQVADSGAYAVNSWRNES